VTTLTEPIDSPEAAVEPLAPRRGSAALRWVLASVRSPTLVISWIIVLLMIGWALEPHLFTSSNPLVGNPENAFEAPSLQHWFGTDELGRDMYARVVYGSRNTLTAVLYAVLVGFFAGGVIGLVSGYLGGIADALVMRVIDVLLSVPSLLLAMTVVAALGYGVLNVALAVGIASIASFARVMRSEVLKVVQSEYVEASRGLGARWPRTLFLHVLPNSIGSLLSLAALEFGTAVLAIAGLGFLGYGEPPPQPEWGLAVSEGTAYLDTYPWLCLIPGAIIAITVLASNRISTATRGRRR
jgi:peptide/nickel transport system permease protein